MTWAEIEQLTQQLPAARQQTSQQLSQQPSKVMVSAHSTIIEGSRVMVLEAFDFLLGAAPPWVRVSRWLATTCWVTMPGPSTWPWSGPTRSCCPAWLCCGS